MVVPSWFFKVCRCVMATTHHSIITTCGGKTTLAFRRIVLKKATAPQLGMSRPITLLHVSDTQFGRNHRFGNLALSPDDTCDTLLTRLGNDLHSLEREHGLRPDVLVLSGDLAEGGFPKEFDDVLQFAEGLTE